MYFDFGGEKQRGNKDIFFDEDCLMLIDKKCQTHKKVVMVSCPTFNWTRDENYKQVLEANKTMPDEMNNYWISQPELKEIDFLQQLMRAKEREAKDPRQKLIPLWELSQYRLWKRVPTNLPFEERKKLFISSPEWNGQIRQLNHHLTADELNEDNVQAEIDHAGILYGMELQNALRMSKCIKLLMRLTVN